MGLGFWGFYFYSGIAREVNKSSMLMLCSALLWSLALSLPGRELVAWSMACVSVQVGAEVRSYIGVSMDGAYLFSRSVAGIRGGPGGLTLRVVSGSEVWCGSVASSYVLRGCVRWWRRVVRLVRMGSGLFGGCEDDLAVGGLGDEGKEKEEGKGGLVE